ncbi:MAG: hypothetical protein OXI71_11600 [Gemmatimonadota bacterium]|nr:hypothetical protein [Gemmatimonadota bacterium]
MLAAAREEGRRRGRSDAGSDLLRSNTDPVFDLYEVTDGRLAEWLAGYHEAWNAERGIVAPRCSFPGYTDVRGGAGPHGIPLTAGCLPPRGCRMLQLRHRLGWIEDAVRKTRR